MPYPENLVAFRIFAFATTPWRSPRTDGDRSTPDIDPEPLGFYLSPYASSVGLGKTDAWISQCFEDQANNTLRRLRVPRAVRLDAKET